PGCSTRRRRWRSTSTGAPTGWGRPARGEADVAIGAAGGMSGIRRQYPLLIRNVSRGAVPGHGQGATPSGAMATLKQHRIHLAHHADHQEPYPPGDMPRYGRGDGAPCHDEETHAVRHFRGAGLTVQFLEKHRVMG